MHHVIPAAQGLRTAYVLMSDRIWFALAVIGCLLVANKLADLLVTRAVPVLERGFNL
jgi:hypothetical protein|tara:strand:+ start:6603 stop:6773 length:171 start_codon:yes stop_codon:yes gene_type:complete